MTRRFLTAEWPQLARLTYPIDPKLLRPRVPRGSRIKRLRGMARPQYRLRLGEIRVFYDVAEAKVEVLAIVEKSDAERWLREVGKPDEESGAI